MKERVLLWLAGAGALGMTGAWLLPAFGAEDTAIANLGGDTVFSAVDTRAGADELQTIRIAGCVRYYGQARYRMPGYDHVVHVESRCEKPVRCNVSTNVDPHKIVIALQPKEAKAVTTRVSSPSRKFTPTVTCVFTK